MKSTIQFELLRLHTELKLLYDFQLQLQKKIDYREKHVEKLKEQLKNK